MKKILAIITLVVFSIPMAWSQVAKPPAKTKCVMPVDTFKGNRRTWILTITPKSKKNYLDSVATAWKTDSILLTFTKMKYNFKGDLIKIAGSVEINVKGGKASASFDCNKLQSEEIKVIDGWSVSVSGNTKQ